MSSGVVVPPDADRDPRFAGRGCRKNGGDWGTYRRDRHLLGMFSSDAPSRWRPVRTLPLLGPPPALPRPLQSADANTQRRDVSSHRSDVTSQCAVASSHCSDVSSHSHDVTSHRTVATSHCSVVTSHRAVVTSHSSDVTSHRAVASSHCADVSSHFSVATSHHADVTSHSSDVTSHRAVASTQNAVGSSQFLVGWACPESAFMKRPSASLQLPAAARRRSRSTGCPGRSPRRRLPAAIPRAIGPRVPRSGR